MSHKVCHDVGNWIDQNISQQVQQCTEQSCQWWCLCCNKWFCWLTWVIVTITSWVIQSVCEIVNDVVDLVVNVVKGIVDVLVGLFTGDWTRLAAGLGEIVGGVVAFVINSIPTAIGGTLVGTFIASRNAWRLRDFVNGLLTDKFGKEDPNGLSKMQDALGIKSGGFGLRLKCNAVRTFIRSDLMLPDTQRPALLDFAEQAGTDLKTLTGFKKPAWWSREWPEVIALDGSDVSESDIDNYLAKGGVGDVKHFTIFSMSLDDMQTRLDTATMHATEIGLLLQWSVTDQQITTADQLIIDADVKFPAILQQPPFLRHNKITDLDTARMELCSPVSIAAFGFMDSGANGISSLFADADCIDPTGGPLTGEGVTGTSFRYRQPDLIFKYVAIHELGHSFGLCHVDGLFRIMYTANGKSFWSGSSVGQYLTNGTEAGFIFLEAQRVWEYILRNFSKSCLETRQF